jgi:hypothetical protein
LKRGPKAYVQPRLGANNVDDLIRDESIIARQGNGQCRIARRVPQQRKGRQCRAAQYNDGTQGEAGE